MISIDYSVIIQAANFLVLIFVLNLILYKPIREGLRQRREKFAGLEKGIDSDKIAAGDKEKALSAGLLKARNKGVDEKEAIVEDAIKQEKEIIGEINDKAAEDLEQLRAKIAEDVKQAKDSLEKEVDTFAAAIGEKILGRAL